jgi:hypothetical protein
LVALLLSGPGGPPEASLGPGDSTVPDGVAAVVLQLGAGDLGQSIAGGSPNAHANALVAGPYYSYWSACRVENRLEDCGYCTAVRYIGGCWYVLYW